MKNAIEWLNEKGGEISVDDVMSLQNDARKDGLMTAQNIASEVIRREAPKYSVRSDPPNHGPDEMALSGLSYYVCSAITSEADKLDYLPRSQQKDPVSKQV
jgi:hypothetical protein